jgi:hypothetical protein
LRIVTNLNRKWGNVWLCVYQEEPCTQFFNLWSREQFNLVLFQLKHDRHRAW